MNTKVSAFNPFHSKLIRTDNKQSLASLLLGGYDSSLFHPSNVNFTFSKYLPRELSAGLRSIRMNGTELLAEPHVSYLDSLTSQIWLPLDSCNLIEKQFNLTWNSTLSLYLIKDDTLHDELLKQNASLEFKLSNDIQSDSANVTVVIPYGSLALELTPEYPHISNTTRYFPIRRATNSTQYTLGRAFFQHAYVIADYERQTFSVNQAIFGSSQGPQLQEIRPPTSASDSPSAQSTVDSPLPAAAMVGIVAGTVSLIVALALCGLWIRWRRQWQSLGITPQASGLRGTDGQALVETEGAARIEVGGDTADAAEMTEKPAAAVEVAAEEPEELAGDWGPCELDGEPHDGAGTSLDLTEQGVYGVEPASTT